METNLTHYSLFNSRVIGLPAEERDPEGKDYVLADFAPIVNFPKLLQKFWELVNDGKTQRNCMWGQFCLHPEGNQISLESNEISLILYSQQGVATQAYELQAEGNDDSARKAFDALQA